jgi:Holliday junction DNA helicase RuvA
VFHHLTGTVVAHLEGGLVLDISGVGYQLQFSSVQPPTIGERVTLYVHQVVRENEIFLCGFSSLEERNLFLNLIKVSGVGPSLSMQILAQADIPSLVSSIVGAETASLTRLKGIGKKTAERIVLELRDRLEIEAFTMSGQNKKQTPQNEPWPEDALLALVALGIQADAARERLERCLQGGMKEGSVDDWVKRALSLGR